MLSDVTLSAHNIYLYLTNRGEKERGKTDFWILLNFAWVLHSLWRKLKVLRLYFSVLEIFWIIKKKYISFRALVIININLSSLCVTLKGFASLFDKIVYSDWNIVIIYTEDKMISLIFSSPNCWRSQSRKLITQDASELFSSSSFHFLLCAKIILLSIWKRWFERSKKYFFF